MNLSNRLSPTASYYVRRLVQSQKTLIFQAIPESNGSEAALLEPETLLNRLGLSPTERQQRVSNLEVLARAYQVLTADGRHPQQALEIETQILRTLGILTAADTVPDPNRTLPTEALHPSPLTVAVALEVMQDFLKSGEMYLGPKIAREYLGMTYDSNLQQVGFVLEDGYQIKVTRPLTETLEGEELQALNAWVQSYLKRCSSIIHGFEALVNQSHLARFAVSRHKI